MATTVPHSNQGDGADGEPRPSRAADPRRQRIVAVEVRRLERHLLTIGPMPEHRLAEGCGAEHWREGTFEEALRQGVRQGILRRLPLGWVEAIRFPGRPPE